LLQGRNQPSTFLAARPVKPAERDSMAELREFVAAHGGTVTPVESDETLIEATRESLAKFCAGIGGPRNRDHLFAAQAAIARTLKRS